MSHLGIILSLMVIEKHSKEYCAMYDICGERSGGKVLNFPYGLPSVKPDELFSAKIQSLCPSINGNVCCAETQFEMLRERVQQFEYGDAISVAIMYAFYCRLSPSLRSFMNLFCELSCSPNQHQFINATSVSEVYYFQISLALILLSVPCTGWCFYPISGTESVWSSIERQQADEPSTS